MNEAEVSKMVCGCVQRRSVSAEVTKMVWVCATKASMRRSLGSDGITDNGGTKTGGGPRLTWVEAVKKYVIIDRRD